ERLGEYVQRRSGGALELRFPIPADVAEAFLSQSGQVRRHVTRSLGTSDVRTANEKADRLRVALRTEIAAIRARRASPDLAGFLRALQVEEVALAEAALRADAKSRLQATFRPDSSDVRSTL